jgi:hypothetical protein
LLLHDGSSVTEHADNENVIPLMLFNLSNLISSTPGLEELSVSFITKVIDHVIKTMLADKWLQWSLLKIMQVHN